MFGVEIVLFVSVQTSPATSKMAREIGPKWNKKVGIPGYTVVKHQLQGIWVRQQGGGLSEPAQLV